VEHPRVEPERERGVDHMLRLEQVGDRVRTRLGLDRNGDCIAAGRAVGKVRMTLSDAAGRE